MSKKIEVRHIEVLEEDDGQRFDRWLKKRVPEIPYGLAQKLIRKGQFRIDGKRAKADTKLQSGQSIRVPPVEDKPQKEKRQKIFTDKDREYIRSLVIYDDGDVVVFNKPSGLASQGGGGVEHHIDAYFPLLEKKGMAPRLVHRLDRDTSGLLLAARSAEAVRRLGKSFRDRRVRKIYWAITAGVPETPEGTIRASLAKASGPHKDKMVVDEKEGKEAITEFAVIEHALGTAAFVAFWPRTGRTHQIRVHAELIGCPVLGDNKYHGNAESIEGLEIASRLHLHAARIVCRHPLKNTTLDIYALLPNDLKKSWKALGFNSSYKDDPFSDI